MLELDLVIQSRLRSARLPFKAALQVYGGNSSIKATVLRCQKIIENLGYKSNVYIACPFEEVHIYEQLCNGTDAIIFGGDPENVAARFLELSEKFNIKKFIRITGDNPFVCQDVVKYLCDIVSLSSVCVSLYHQKDLPNGTVISMISQTYLKNIVKVNDKLANEHIIIGSSEQVLVQIDTPKIPENLKWPTGRFCLDDEEDYLYILNNHNLKDLLTVSEMKTKLTARENVRSY